LLSIFVIAPLGPLAIDRPLFGNWIWHIELEWKESQSMNRLTNEGREINKLVLKRERDA
jgi:hypothetical protein